MIKGQLFLDRARWLMGWMSEGELSFLAEISNVLPEDSIIIEIGCFCGRSTRAIADNSPETARIYCIDPWNYIIPLYDVYGNTLEPMIVDDSTFDQFCLNLDYHINTERVMPYKIKWEDAIDPPLSDFIFIDGDHTYEAVKHDIQKALQYLKPNGILAGHDYTNFEGVYQAVNERFQKTDIEVRETIWCIRKS